MLKRAAAYRTACVAVVAIVAASGSAPAVGWTGEEPPVEAAPATVEAPDPMRGLETFEAVCGMCHELSRATDVGRTRAGWNQIVGMMVGHGMTATSDQIKEIVDYLSVAYPAAPPPAAAAPTAPLPDAPASPAS
ncbi:MAG: hypothetical protein ABS78_02185 [Phenylobacterium sp. SCN 70-31]|nr:MAG: hypothetical protein ABS78_02185 [Phenylobacterium sp. SCN 70-31]